MSPDMGFELGKGVYPTLRAHSLRERLENPEAFLSRTDLRDLGFGRRAVDAIVRSLDAYYLCGFSRPFVRVRDFHALMERSRYDDARVR
jgi:hypothetical protein